jgi:hypothetical protein
MTMHGSDNVDLSPLRAADWPAHADRLADRIAARLGSPPRPLPAPLQLAFEAVSGRVLLAAAITILLGTGFVALLGSADEPVPFVTDLISGERAPTAANVYLALRGYQP